MKTPMQELIDSVEYMAQELLNADELYDYLMEKATQMLEKEKELIIKTYNHACLHGLLFEPDGEEIVSAQDYYNKTFKTKER